MNFLILLLFMTRINIPLTSATFATGGNIPSKYTCEGLNINPPLAIGETPTGTKSLVLIVDDPDGDKGVITHWVAFNIAPDTKLIDEGGKPGTIGKNEKGAQAYMGPCPPTGQHHYYFKVYAIDKMLDLKAGASKSDVLNAINGHILGEGELVGLYKKETIVK